MQSARPSRSLGSRLGRGLRRDRQPSAAHQLRPSRPSHRPGRLWNRIRRSRGGWAARTARYWVCEAASCSDLPRSVHRASTRPSSGACGVLRGCPRFETYKHVVFFLFCQVWLSACKWFSACEATDVTVGGGEHLGCHHRPSLPPLAQCSACLPVGIVEHVANELTR